MYRQLLNILEEIDPEFEGNLHDLRISHVLKCWPKFFKETRLGNKSFDLRKHKTGRTFSKGQYVIFREWDPETKTYTALWDLYYVKYVLKSEQAIPFGFDAYPEGLGGDILALIHVTGN